MVVVGITLLSSSNLLSKMGSVWQSRASQIIVVITGEFFWVSSVIEKYKKNLSQYAVIMQYKWQLKIHHFLENCLILPNGDVIIIILVIS